MKNQIRPLLSISRKHVDGFFAWKEIFNLIKNNKLLDKIKIGKFSTRIRLILQNCQRLKCKLIS